MTSFHVGARCTFDAPLAREELEAHADALMEALLDLGVQDPAVSVTFSTCVIEVELVGVEAPTAAEALRQSSDIVTQAVEKLGHTVDSISGVPSGPDPEEWTVRRQPGGVLTSA